MMSIRIISSGSIDGGPSWGKTARARYEPTTNRERRPSCERGDLPESPHQEKMNKKAALGGDPTAPSSSASAANRMTATESLFPEIINDFCNKIGTKQRWRKVLRLLQ